MTVLDKQPGHSSRKQKQLQLAYHFTADTLGVHWCPLTLLQVPFMLSCGTPGRLRWVTTNIARFDPSVDWPTDLACTFDWNKDLKTFDG